MTTTTESELELRVNGQVRRGTTLGRTTLADHLRESLGLTGTRLGCEQGACGACTVLMDGASVRSCLVLAGQANGARILTVEGLADAGLAGRELQRAFIRYDALQCGFCTSGMLMSSFELLRSEYLDEATVRTALSGNLCRCTAYDGIVRAVLDVHRRLGPVQLADDPRAEPPASAMPRPTPRTPVLATVAAGAALVAVAVVLRHRRRH